MKKTLIALTVAAGAVMSVSGVANAYTPAFSNGDISLGGTISTPVQASLYEGKVGSLTGLDATIPVGQTSATITVNGEGGLLALRSVESGIVSTASDKIANITFDGKTLLDAASGTAFNSGVIDMTLDAHDSTGNKIGNIVFPMQVAAVTVTVDDAASTAVGASLYSPNDSTVFYGGLPKTKEGALQTYSGAMSKIEGLFTDIGENLPEITSQGAYAELKNFGAADKTFHTAYAAGINSGDTVTINLDNAATTGDVSWTASLPVVVTYK